jgi:hypothetical protein
MKGFQNCQYGSPLYNEYFLIKKKHDVEGEKPEERNPTLYHSVYVKQKSGKCFPWTSITRRKRELLPGPSHDFDIDPSAGHPAVGSSRLLYLDPFCKMRILVLLSNTISRCINKLRATEAQIIIAVLTVVKLLYVLHSVCILFTVMLPQLYRIKDLARF